MRTSPRSNHNVVFSCKYHVVWCPKYRRKVLVDGVDERLRAIVRSVVAERDAEVIELEVMPDHVHLLVEVDPQLVCEGRPYRQPRHRIGTGVVGLDIGPSTLAAVSAKEAMLVAFCPEVEQPAQKARRLQRHIPGGEGLIPSLPARLRPIGGPTGAGDVRGAAEPQG